jgi:hypothetical protein
VARLKGASGENTDHRGLWEEKAVVMGSTFTVGCTKSVRVIKHLYTGPGATTGGVSVKGT